MEKRGSIILQHKYIKSANMKENGSRENRIKMRSESSPVLLAA